MRKEHVQTSVSAWPLCCGQVSSNNPGVSVPSFSAWHTFPHLSQSPAATLEQIPSNTLQRAVAHKDGIKKASFWRLSNPTEAEDVILWLQFERNGTFPLSCHLVRLCFFLLYTFISSSFQSCHPESRQMSEDSETLLCSGTICILKYTTVVWPISLRSCDGGQYF